MANLKELYEKRETLLIEIELIRIDLKEYIDFPVETVDCEQIKYQYGFVLREIKKIDDMVKTILLSQMEALKLQIRNLETLLEIQQKRSFILISELPEKRPNMFQELLTVPQIKEKFKDYSFDCVKSVKL